MSDVSPSRNRCSVLVVGQVPPPIHGQAIMIRAVLQIPSPELRFFHVPLDSSLRTADTGHFQVMKVFRTLRTICRIYKTRLLHPEIRILYYAPGGTRLGLARDVFVLSCVRFLFPRLVFHFHAGGFDDQFQSLGRLGQRLVFRALRHADVAVHVCEENTSDSAAIEPKRVEVVLNAVPDQVGASENVAAGSENHPGIRPGPPIILYLGRLSAEKGIWIFLEGAALLLAWGCDFRLRIVGAADDEASLSTLKKFVSEHGLEERTEFLGELSGEQKAWAYQGADIFCNPTYYQSEALPLTALDAMKFQKPSVLAQWRGLISLSAGETAAFGFPIKDPKTMAEKLRLLLESPELREQMGKRARTRYLEHHTIDRFQEKFKKIFLSL